MRFIENGPSIPDELLTLRDEGQVVVFCGAGVSQARAGLPNFFKLAQSVIGALGASEECDACKVLKKAKDVSAELNINGLITADRVFSLLERDFTVADIQSAVAKSLRPPGVADSSAHRLLVRLASTPDARLQLVTTNFDRLFEECAPGLACFQHPRLPQPSHQGDFNGIVYLHGRVNHEYTEAESNGLILTSSDFGHAYLSEGWATDFFRDIVRRYVVLFIGYSADDPPIHYLLEGLNKSRDSARPLFAFQADGSEQAVAHWRHKGVEVIPYSESTKHFALWQTLESWAQRADNPDAWQRDTLTLAMGGPTRLKPYQRGQVTHIASTTEGARAFVKCKPPADWLCTFDPRCRYATPTRTAPHDPGKPITDPFAEYGLDSDAPPETIDPDDYYATRSVPVSAWDAFAANAEDLASLRNLPLATLRGQSATDAARLPKRLEYICRWIASVSDQPAAIWWGSRQDLLHPGLQRAIAWHIQSDDNQVTSAIRDAWRYLFEAKRTSGQESRHESYDYEQRIKREGWSRAAARGYYTSP